MAPKDWAQVNQDGFGYPPGDYERTLFDFGGRLFAVTGHGVFRLESLMCCRWEKVYTPGSEYAPMGGQLYCWDQKSGQMWKIDAGGDFNTVGNWDKVTSKGTPGGAHPAPMTVFGNHLYGVLHPGGGDEFEIWRTSDIGASALTWNKVVSNSFGHPANNTGLGVMGVFNGKVFAGTTTLVGWFGSPQQPGDGVEIWESASGDQGSWMHVNTPGFGTEISYPSIMRVNHLIGSWAVYREPGQTKDHLYIGTSSHWGGEVWRYDGTGPGGWVCVRSTVDPAFGGACRNTALVPFKGSLYLAEGYPTGDLSRYDGTNWHVLEPGPNPFHPENGGIGDLTVFQGRLLAITVHLPYGGTTKGDQVYAYPFYPVPAFVCNGKDLLRHLLYTRPRSLLDDPYWGSRLKKVLSGTSQPARGRGRGNPVEPPTTQAETSNSTVQQQDTT